MRLQIPIAILQENGNQWNHSLIFTLLDGGHHNPNHVMRSVKIKWKIIEVCDMVRAGHNRFICRFSNVNDQERIEEQQPWVVLGSLILMETFSTGMVAANITFERLPLWMSFRGLELEHLHSNTVRFIGEVAGVVTNVLPVGVIPRTAERFQVLVNVNVNEPLVQGRFVNTLSNGDVWVAFRYNNLPTLFYSSCNRLGHTANHQANNTMATLPDERIQSRQLILWPHEQANVDNQATVHARVEPHRDHYQQDEDVNLGPDLMDHNCSHQGPKNRLVSLISSELAFSARPTAFAKPASLPTVGQSPTTSPTTIYFKPTATTLNITQAQPTTTTLPSQLRPRQLQQPLRIQEPSPDTTPPPHRGRGRPPGSTTKNKKANQNEKCKGKMPSDEAESKPLKSKKRKILNAESASSTTPYILEPPPTFIPRRNTIIAATNGTFDNLDLISQMYANTILTNLLIQQGALNPRVLQTLVANTFESNLNQPLPTPNWNPSSPNSTLQGPYHNCIEATSYEPHLNNNNILIPNLIRNLNDIPSIITSPIITSPGTEGPHITHSPSGGIEFGQRYTSGFNLGVQASMFSESPDFASPVVNGIYNQ
ncbi:hypothetical protein FRX31_010658, partial [Thalictrum thalictroides]